MQWLKTFLLIYWPAMLLFVLLFISELLSMMKSVRANGVVQLIIHIIERFAGKAPGVAAVESAFEKNEKDKRK